MLTNRRKKNTKVLCVLVFACILVVSKDARAEDTSHLALVNEFVHELSTLEHLRDDAQWEIKSDKTQSEIIASQIHWSARVQIALQADITNLNGMHLDKPFDQVIPSLVNTYELKIKMHQDMIDRATAFLAGPKPGVDYGNLAADMPKLRAYLDESDHTIFQISPLVYAILIDQKPDSQNHTSHMIITKEQRESLLQDLKIDFGDKLTAKDQNYIVAAAGVLEDFLKDKKRKCSDEPWN